MSVVRMMTLVKLYNLLTCLRVPVFAYIISCCSFSAFIFFLSHRSLKEVSSFAEGEPDGVGVRESARHSRGRSWRSRPAKRTLPGLFVESEMSLLLGIRKGFLVALFLWLSPVSKSQAASRDTAVAEARFIQDYIMFYNVQHVCVVSPGKCLRIPSTLKAKIKDRNISE